MKKKTTKTWSIQKSQELYGFQRWGNGNFSVDAGGCVEVRPLGDQRSIRVLDVIQEARSKGLRTPLLIRFQDLLRQRVEQINEAFATAIKEEKYDGVYRGVFPIKVNQMREVVEEIIDAGEPFGFGLEAGSKPELMIALAIHHDPESLLICNGYKDDEYIRLAMLGSKLGKKVIIVIEQVSEIEPILRLSREYETVPIIGIRVKLLSQGEGKWATSTGDQSKFGLNTTQILSTCHKLREAGMADALQLLHFHIGSQVPNIITIKNAVVEAARFYCQLAKLGFPMGYLDVGGGLGIDYDGSRSNFESSMNYSMEEYARDIVFNIREVCASAEIPTPDIVSESGRAIVAPHSMLVVEVFDRITKVDTAPAEKPSGEPHPIVDELEHILKSKRRYSQLERFHDALQKKEEAYSLFNHGYLDLENRAYAENLFWKICQALEDEKKESAYHPEELFELRKMLAEQYVCNFSVFQSLLDHWAFNQLFPVAPLHRLKQRPDVNAVLVDITCDSDGKISHFIDLEEDVKEYLPLHGLDGKPYYLGVFLTGAYQDIMGDLHNLFGRVNEVHVFLEDNEEDGYYIEQVIRGNPISEILELIQYKENDLLRAMKRQIDRATKKNKVKPRQGTRLLDFYEDLIRSKTYLNIDNEPKKKPARRRAARKKA